MCGLTEVRDEAISHMKMWGTSVNAKDLVQEVNNCLEIAKHDLIDYH